MRRGNANVAVARVSCISRAPRRLGDCSDVVCCLQEIRMFGADVVIKPEENRVLEKAQIEVPG